MKNYIIILISLGLSFSTKAQIENIQFDNDLNFEKIYAGFETKMIVPNDSLVASSNAALRLGTALRWSLNKSISVYSHGAFQWSNTHQPFAITAFVLNFKLSERLSFAAGLPPTATTFTRAHPITWKNQTESYAQSRILGNKPGALLQYSITDKLHLAYSFQNLDGNTWSNHLNVSYGKISLAGYIQEDNEAFVSMRINNNRIDANYNYSSIIGEHATSVFFNITEKYALYGDVNYLSDTKKSEVATLGARKYFENSNYHTRGFLSIQYDINNKQTVFQLFLHLQ